MENPKETLVEELAKILHEAGREAVENNNLVNPNIHKKFLEWDGLEERMKEGRRIQARFLLNHPRVEIDITIKL